MTYNSLSVQEAESEEGGDEDEVGGLFRIAKKSNEQKANQQATANSIDCSVFSVQNMQDWDLGEVFNVVTIFVRILSHIYF